MNLARSSNNKVEGHYTLVRKTFNKTLSKLKSPKVFWFVILGILLTNSVIYITTNTLSIPPIQNRGATSGFSFSKGKEFAYFHYYTGYFPLATLNSDLNYSVKGAKKEIQENGEDLIMEYQHWSRLGENARIWAFLPNSLIAGSPEKPSLKLFNTIIFTFSLIILYIGFWYSNHRIYGFILVTIINLTPFYLFEVYSNENIFALLGSVFFIILGLNSALILNSKNNIIKAVIIAIISGGIIGFFSEFRNEISIVIVSLVLIYLLSNGLKKSYKFYLLMLSILSFYSTKELIRNYFNYKFEETASLVEAHNGNVYKGMRISGHIFWHSVFCGLGDFDTKYGYEWNDKVAYKYAVPILQNKYGMDISYSNKKHLDNYYDSKGLYYIKFDEIEEYETVMKDKVVKDIKNDPFWYAEIIIKRIIRVLSSTLPFPFIGWMIFYILFLSIKNHSWNYHLKLILVSLPLSLTPIMIYSGKGVTYNSVFAYFVIITLVFLVLNKEKKLTKT